MKKLSNWVNLQDVFAAQQDQGARMNDAVYGGLEQTGFDAQKRIRDAASGFQRRVQSETQRTTANMGARTGAQAQASSQAQYAGPRTLREYDPSVSSAVGDAAARINASSAQQYQQQYGTGGSVRGGAMDQALMARAGGNERRANLTRQYGSLGDELRAEQTKAGMMGQQAGDYIAQLAAMFGAQAPELFQREAVEKRRREDAELRARNEEARRKYDEEWNARTNRFKRTRGNELQASYAPPESEMLPYYPVS